MASIVWFKRDLRAADHPALARAAARGPVLPLYIADPAAWGGAEASGRQWDFVAESLAELRAALARLGAPLVVRQGEAVAVLADLCRRHRITQLFSHEETGTLATFARDRAVGAWARGAGVAWEELPQTGVIRRLAHRSGWAARRDAFIAAPFAPTPALTAVPGVDPGPIPATEGLGLPPDPCPGRQPGGRAAGLRLLDSFLSARGAPYRRAMSSPGPGAEACSRLSPHLAWGTLSGREVVRATAHRQQERPGGPWGGSLAAFQARLAWRDHFAQKLEDAPDIEARALHPATETLCGPADPDRLGAWDQGRTGLPFADACMRSLIATGWLNFRMRAMLVSLGCHLLGLDWRVTGPVLARRFTDFDPGIHWPQMQMQAGATGINTLRIYNPVKQGRDQDPDGAFTRAWVPELAAVPDHLLQTPWARGEVPGYPAPVVDPRAAAAEARERLWGLRRQSGFAAEAARVALRHASRRDPRFVDDRVPRNRRPKPPPAQTAFDFGEAP